MAKNKLTIRQREAWKKKLSEVQTQITFLETKELDVPQSLLDERNKIKNKLNQNKYNAKKVDYNGQVYDSEIEADYAKFLDKLKIPYERQVTFTLMEAFSFESDYLIKKEKIQDICLTVDFVIYNTIIIDIKGHKATQTQEFLIKWKLLKNIFRGDKVYLKIEKRSEFPISVGIIKKVKEDIDAKV